MNKREAIQRIQSHSNNAICNGFCLQCVSLKAKFKITDSDLEFYTADNL